MLESFSGCNVGLAGLTWLEKIRSVCDDVELAFESPNRVDDCSGKDVRNAGRCLDLKIAALLCKGWLDGGLFSLSSKRSTSIVVSCKNTFLEISVLLIWVMIRDKCGNHIDSQLLSLYTSEDTDLSQHRLLNKTKDPRLAG